jgi:predicted esterase
MIQPLILAALTLSSPCQAFVQVEQKKAPRVTRQDLADVVQDIDAAFTAGRRLPATDGRSALAETNLAFDAITETFFSLNLVEAMDELLTMRVALFGDNAEPFLSTRVEGKPPVKIRGAPLRAELLKRWEALGDGVPAEAARAFKSRARLKWEAPSPAKSNEFLIDPAPYEASLQREILALESGVSPYALRRGDHWRTFAHGRRDLGARVFCPNSAPDSGMPLVVAFHGAGGDENFLFEIAGQGHIKALAERSGALVVAPFTIDFMSSKKAFESLLRGIKVDYEYDETRVYVLGHSMGAMATAKLCHEVPSLLTAAACIAGFSASEFDASLPIAVFSGELDAIVPFAGVKAAAERAAKAGAQVRFTPMEDQGHTLLLPSALDLIFEGWFP